MGLLSGGTSNVETKPWDAARPYLRQGMEAAGNMFEAGTLAPAVYEGNRVAGYSGATRDALNALPNAVNLGAARNVRGNMNGMFRQARRGILDMMSDDNMYRDFDRIRGAVGDDAQARMGSMFHGGLDSGLAQQNVSEGISNALANVEYGAWNDQQGRRLQALGLMPTVQGMAGAGADYMTGARLKDATATLQAGGFRDQMAQRRLDADRQLFNEQQMQPIQNLQQLMAIAGGAGGMGSDTQQPGVGGFDSIKGGALTGAGLYAAGANPYLAAGVGLLSAL